MTGSRARGRAPNSSKGGQRPRKTPSKTNGKKRGRSKPKKRQSPNIPSDLQGDNDGLLEDSPFAEQLPKHFERSGPPSRNLDSTHFDRQNPEHMKNLKKKLQDELDFETLYPDSVEVSNNADPHGQYSIV